MNKFFFVLMAVLSFRCFNRCLAQEAQASEPAIDFKTEITKYCETIDKEFTRYSWGKSNCQDINWIFVRHSINGHPIMWVTFGAEPEVSTKEKDITLIMCGVHGDEITPIKFCFDVIQNAKENNENYIKQNRVVIIAPLVNPDSFINPKPSRTNARGVDVNRNFPTKDWNKRALKVWRNNNGKDPRRFPGDKPFSEPETIFQVNLIKRYAPDKILSVHAPLTLLDYDGPSKTKKKVDKNPVGHMANSLLIEMGQKAKGYKIKDFPFYAGSLGNWAGNERKIPTYTLELPSSDPSKSAIFWALFKEAIDLAITSNLRVPLEETADGENKAAVKVGEKNPDLPSTPRKAVQ